MQLHLAQCCEEMLVSGYYWGPPTPPADTHCVAWLDISLDGPSTGKQDCIANLSFTLGDDTHTSFMKFYTSLKPPPSPLLQVVTNPNTFLALAYAPPPHYLSTGMPPPLILVLHGAGCNNQDIMSNLEKPQGNTRA
jgi:hypothetical protein